MSRNRMYALAAACVVAIGGCVHQATGAPSDTSVITESEIDSLGTVTAYEVVNRLRPMFLVSRGKLELDPQVPRAMPNVYVDNQFYGDISVLHAISAATIETIKFYNSSEAQYKFGRGNAAGVIGIFTKH